jgi:hypothetical protein
MQTIFETITAQAPEGQFLEETVTTNLQPVAGTEVLISCALQQVDQHGANGQAQVSITSYVEKGQTQTGRWSMVRGSEITSVTAVLRAAGAAAAATLLVLGYKPSE